MYHKFCWRLFTLLGFICSIPSHGSALPTDKTKPFIAKAEHAFLDQIKHMSRYQNHVFALQGTSQLNADRLEILTDTHNQVHTATAYGNPARYQTLPKLNTDLFYAEADKIIYYLSKQKIILQGHASAKRANNQFKASVIEYYPDTGEVYSLASSEGQTHMILQIKS